MMQREELMSRLLLAILSCIVLSLSCGAFADPQYPTKPVRFIVPYGAGGAPDVLARIIAKELSMQYRRGLRRHLPPTGTRCCSHPKPRW